MYILQIMNYAASYRGNFIESIEEIEKQSNNKMKNVYLFGEDSEEKSASWINEMKKEGKIIYFLTDSDWKNYCLIKKIIKMYNIGVVHMHFLGIRMHTLVNFARIGKKIRLVRHFHNHSDYCFHAFKRIYGHLFYRNAILVGVSDSVSDSIRRDFPKNKVYTINNAINFERLNNCEKSSLNINDSSSSVLMFGFDYERKGVDLIIDAIFRLREQGQEMQLFIVFSTFVEENIAKIKKQLSCEKLPEWLHILPPRNDIASYYNKVDIFASPSREEGFCYAIPEAAWCGCNVVMSEIGGQTFHKGMPQSFLCEPNNVESLMNVLLIATTCHRADCDKAKTREYLMENYSIQKWAENIINLYS